MSILSGPSACTRYNVLSMPDSGPEFDAVPPRPIQLGSEIVASAYPLPLVQGGEYNVGGAFYAFKVRLETVKPSGKLVAVRYDALLAEALKHGEVQTRSLCKALKKEAFQSVQSQTLAKVDDVDCIISGRKLYILTASNSKLGSVVSLLLRLGVEVEAKTPWGDDAIDGKLFERKGPHESGHGPILLDHFIRNELVTIEPEKGRVQLLTDARGSVAKVSLGAGVNGELDRYLQDGAEIIAAKIMLEEWEFNFDSVTYRVSGLSLNPSAGDWQLVVTDRLEELVKFWTALDELTAEVWADVFDNPRPAQVSSTQEDFSHLVGKLDGVILAAAGDDPKALAILTRFWSIPKFRQLLESEAKDGAAFARIAQNIANRLTPAPVD